MRKNWALNIVSEPANEPVTLDELKDQAHISHDYQDTILQSYLFAARKKAEEYQRVSYITQTIELTLNDIPVCPIRLLRGPVQSLVSVKVYDEDNAEHEVDLSNFYLDTGFNPGILALNSSGEWPNVTLRDIGAVKITYIAGYGDTSDSVPETVKHAIILFASFNDDNRAADNPIFPASFYNMLKPTRIEYNEPW